MGPTKVEISLNTLLGLQLVSPSPNSAKYCVFSVDFQWKGGTVRKNRAFPCEKLSLRETVRKIRSAGQAYVPAITMFERRRSRINRNTST